LFGTYVASGELLLYPSYSYSLDNDREYQPAKLGFGSNQDFLGRFRSSEGLLFIGYGLTDGLAVEFEASLIRATLERSASDTSAGPTKIRESGFGDLEGQLRVRLMREGDRRPEVFGYLEMTPPSLTRKVLIGAPDWDFKPGIGLVRGLWWGTVTLRTTFEYNRDDTHYDIGETSLEYLRRLSPAWHLYLGVEGGETGAPDEWDLVSGIRWHLADIVSLKFDNSLGITPKATDWAPRIGLLFSFPN